MPRGSAYGARRLQSAAPIIWEAAFDALPLSTSANAAELRAALAAMGLTLTRASSATVQTGASTIVASGIGVDDPRVGDAGYARGLVIEESRQGLLPSSASANWTLAGTATRATTDGPDGGASSASRVQMPANGDGVYSYITTATIGAKYTRTVWLRGVSGSTVTIRNISSGALEATVTLASTWQRVVLTAAANASAYGIMIQRSATTATYVDVWHGQLEAGAFGGELVVTTGASATRTGDRLAVAGSRVVRDGAVSLSARFAPKGLIGDYPYGFFLACNASNTPDVTKRCYAWINQTNSRLYVRLNGVDWYPTTPIVWAIGDVIDVHFSMGPSGARASYCRNGGATVSLGSSGAVAGAIDSSITWDILGNTTSSPASAWLQRVQAYAPGRRPAWAA